MVGAGEQNYTWVMVVKEAGSGSKIPPKPLVSIYSLLAWINARIDFIAFTRASG